MLEIDFDTSNKILSNNLNEIGILCGMRRDDKILILEYITTPNDGQKH
jgi:hypothetical protein